MMKKVLVLALSLGLTASAVMAQDYQKVKGGLCALTRSLSINELADSAGVIFRGSLVSVDEKNLPIKGQNHELGARVLTFKVEDAIKGVDASTYTAYEWDSLSSPFTTGEVEAGKTYVFFFNSPSEKTGLSSLVGFEQGLVTFKEGVPQISSRVIAESRDVLGEVDSNIKSLSLGRANTSKSPKSYDELKSLIEQLQ